VLEKKVVCILHGLEVEHFYRSISLKRPFRLFHERAVIAAKKRIFVSRFYLEKYSQNVRSISRQGNEVIYPELSISKVPMENVDSHRVETLRFITVSRFDLKKGFRHIAPIIACLRDSKVKFSWTLVGDGPDQQLIKNMFEEYEEVEIFGSASREVIPRLYEKADIFCQISDYEETFGLVYTEAQLHGLFCIASFLGATSESIIEGNGCLVNSADLNATKILSAIFDRPAKSVIRQKCLAKFQHQNKKWAGAIYDDFSV
jgi:glycosyltransferase involved in cell wall biosynthesis